MREDEILFFAGHADALPLYEALRDRVLTELDGAHIKVSRTQIAFANRHNFAFVSFLPVRRAGRRPGTYITVSFGLRARVDSPRIDAATEPYPERWTHHVLVASPDQIDDELMGWITEAAVFSAAKR